MHPALLTICTPEGRVSRYFSGIKYNPRDLRLSLYEAGEGKVGSVTDQVLLLCFHYDPESGTYSWAAIRLMQFGGALTLIIFAGMLTMFWLREWRKAKRRTSGRNAMMSLSSMLFAWHCLMQAVLLHGFCGTASSEAWHWHTSPGSF